MPVVFVLCTVGSFAIASRFFDIYVMLAFGIIGFFLRQLNYPMAPLVLGIVLGDLLDKNLRRGLTLSDGDLSPFFTRPICFVMFCLVAGTDPDERSGRHQRRQPAVDGCDRGLAPQVRAAPDVRMKISLCNEVLAGSRFRPAMRTRQQARL